LVPQQTLLRLLKTEEGEGGVFQPEDVAVMTTAFDGLLADFKLVNRDDPVVTMLAKLVIEMVRTGERDPEQIRKQILGRHRAS
jgi:predicted RNase H-like nuclease